MSLKETCRCGHDKDTHFEKKHTCLARCDCKRYVLFSEPDPPKQEFKAASRYSPVEEDIYTDPDSWGADSNPFFDFDSDIDIDPCPTTMPMFPAAPKVGQP